MNEIKKITAIRLLGANSAAKRTESLHIPISKDLADQLNWNEYDTLTFNVIGGNLVISRSTDQREKLSIVVVQHPSDILSLSNIKDR